MLKILEVAMRSLGLEPESSLPKPLTGLVLQPFAEDSEEPFWTFSRAMRKELSKLGVLFAKDAELTCELDWEILGGSHLKLIVAMKIDDIFIKTDVREGDPLREVVDFNIHKTIRMDETRKTLMFFKKGAEKLSERLARRYHNDLGRRRSRE